MADACRAASAAARRSHARYGQYRLGLPVGYKDVTRSRARFAAGSHCDGAEYLPGNGWVCRESSGALPGRDKRSQPALLDGPSWMDMISHPNIDTAMP